MVQELTSAIAQGGSQSPSTVQTGINNGTIFIAASGATLKVGYASCGASCPKFLVVGTVTGPGTLQM
jgi:hypothetical protein